MNWSAVHILWTFPPLWKRLSSPSFCQRVQHYLQGGSYQECLYWWSYQSMFSPDPVICSWIPESEWELRAKILPYLAMKYCKGEGILGFSGGGMYFSLPYSERGQFHRLCPVGSSAKHTQQMPGTIIWSISPHSLWFLGIIEGWILYGWHHRSNTQSCS